MVIYLVKNRSQMLSTWKRMKDFNAEQRWHRVGKPVLDSTGRCGNAKNKDKWKLLGVSTVNKIKRLRIFRPCLYALFNFRYETLLTSWGETKHKNYRIYYCICIKNKSRSSINWNHFDFTLKTALLIIKEAIYSWYYNFHVDIVFRVGADLMARIWRKKTLQAL